MCINTRIYIGKRGVNLGKRYAAKHHWPTRGSHTTGASNNGVGCQGFIYEIGREAHTFVGKSLGKGVFRVFDFYGNQRITESRFDACATAYLRVEDLRAVAL